MCYSEYTIIITIWRIVIRDGKILKKMLNIKNYTTISIFFEALPSTTILTMYSESEVPIIIERKERDGDITCR
jgi:hypothetical protein